MSSFKPEFQTDDSGKWYGNALRFATEREAMIAARSTAMRWMAVREYRAAPSDDPVNYRVTDEMQLEEVPASTEVAS